MGNTWHARGTVHCTSNPQDHAKNSLTGTPSVFFSLIDRKSLDRNIGLRSISSIGAGLTRTFSFGQHDTRLDQTNTEAKERFIKEEERNSRRELQQFEENEELCSQNKELQQIASQHLHMWKISKEQRVALSDSYNHLQVEALTRTF